MLLTAITFHNTQPSLAATLPTPTSWGPLAFLATMVLLRSQGLGSATALDLATTSSGGGFQKLCSELPYSTPDVLQKSRTEFKLSAIGDCGGPR